MKEKELISHKLEHERVGRLLLRFSIPAIVSMAATSFYNIIDSIFIGHGVGPLGLSAMGVTFPLMNIVFAVSLLIGIGGAASVSIFMGQRNQQGTACVLGNVVVLNIIMSVALSGVSLLVLDPVLHLFGASSETLPYARDFMVVILLGNPIFFTMFNLNHLMRSSGYPSKAMLSILLSVGFNVVLAPIFIFWLNWGMGGAALATVLSQCIALIWVLAHFVRKASALHFQKDIYGLRREIVGRIFSIGLSPCLLNLCACLVVIFINKALLVQAGDLGIGAYSILNRLFLLFVLIAVGLSQGMQPIIGFNFGAGLWKRMFSTLNICLLAGTLITSTGFVLAVFFPEQVAAIFTDDAELRRMAVQGMRVALVVLPLTGSQVVIQNFFQCIGHSKSAILLSVTRQMVVLIPLLLILPPYFGIWGVWASIATSEVASFCLALLLLLLFLRKYRWGRRPR